MDDTTRNYDVIVVGARVAGASTAMLLARHGLRVLVLERGRYGTDTLSTHALMRGGVFLLGRWGMLGQIVDAGTPAVHQTRFDYGSEQASVDIRPTPGVPALYAPRRALLDRLLVDAAVAAGAHVRFGVTVTGLDRDAHGRVCGIVGHDRRGDVVTARAPLTVGADGVRSTVARIAGAPTSWSGRAAGAVIYGYWSELAVDGYEWFYRPGCSAGLIPTGGGEVCVFAGAPADRLMAATTRQHREDTYFRLLDRATSGAAGRLARASRPSRLRTWVGRPGYLRQTHGPGWALVGDAGSYQDPLSTHGITDGLRDAELLARSMAATPTDLATALAQFGRARHRVVEPLALVVDQIASYAWDRAELQRLLRQLSALMGAELELITGPAAEAPAASGPGGTCGSIGIV